MVIVRLGDLDISDIQQVLTQVADGDLRTEPQVDYKGDFVLIRGSLRTITRSMNETLLGFRAAADRLMWTRWVMASVWTRVWPLLWVTSDSRCFTRPTSCTSSSVDWSKAIIQTGVVLTADTAGSLRAISEVSAQISTQCLQYPLRFS